MAAEDAELVIEDPEAFGGALIAAIEDKTMGVDDGSRANILPICPEGWARGGAGGAQNALGGVIEAGALFRALQTLLPRRRIVVDQVGLYRAVMLEE